MAGTERSVGRAEARRAPLPPGSEGNLAEKLGRARALNRDILGYMLWLREQFGDISYFGLGRYHSYMVCHPDQVREMLSGRPDDFQRSSRSAAVLGRLLGNGLVISDGEFWRRQRRLMQPAFHKSRIGAYAEVMARLASDAADLLRPGRAIDVAELMMGVTLEIVAETLFGTTVEGETARVGAAVANAQRAVMTLSQGLVVPPEWLPTRANRELRHATASLDELLLGIIRERRRAVEDRGDLLSMLLLAAEGEERMSDRQVRDEAMTLFLAGHETSANALSWSWYLISQHPEVEARLHAELDEVLGSRPPTLDDLPRLVYTERVIQEAMRLYPPAWVISREATRETTLGGYRVIEGAYMIVSPYVTHRDPRFFPDPERFDPDRFAPEQVADRPRDAYFPFGDGPHICLGNRFAMMEVQIVLAVIAQRYRLELAAGHPVEPEPLVALRPRHGLVMIPHAR